MPRKDKHPPETAKLENDLATMTAIFVSLEEPFSIERLTDYWRIHTPEKIFEFTRLGKLRSVENQFAWPRLEGEYYARRAEERRLA